MSNPTALFPPNLLPLQLQSLGVQQNAITFTNVTMESDKHICVRETGDQSQLVRRARGAHGAAGKQQLLFCLPAHSKTFSCCLCPLCCR